MRARYLAVAILATGPLAAFVAAADDTPPYVPILDIRTLRVPEAVTATQTPRRRAALPPQIGATDLTSAPLPADLYDTVDAPLSEGIRALAARHNGDSVGIFDEVRNTIFFEPYYGSRKGADMALRQQSGSALDIASIVIAAARAAGHPARYVFGRVNLTSTQQHAWLGTNSPSATVTVLQHGGIPASAAANGNVEMEHAWAAVWNGQRWVQLDAAFKTELEHRPSLRPATLSPLSGFLQTVNATGALDVPKRRVLLAPRVLSATAPNDYDQDIRLMAARYGQSVSASAAQVTSTTTERDAYGWSEIVPQHDTSATGLLPLPLAAGHAITASSFVSPALRSYLTITIQPLTHREAAVLRASLPSLAGKRITVMPIPATAADAALIDQHGGILHTPTNVQAVSVIYVDGREVARGPATRLDDVATRTLLYEQPLRTPVSTDNQMITGDMLSVAIDYGRTSVAELQSGRAQLLSTMATLPRTPDGTPLLSSPLVLGEAINGSFLRSVGQTYHAQLDAYRQYFANALGVRWVQGAAVGWVLQSLRVDLLSPNNPSHGFGLGFDMPILQSYAWSETASPGMLRTFHTFTGSISSGLEHSIWEALGIRAISAVRLLHIASERGIPIRHDVTKDEWFADNASFHLSVGSIIAITDAVLAGNVVTVPEREMNVGKWRGTGIIVTEPATGISGYLISGRLFSGDSSIIFGGSIINAILDGVGIGLAVYNIGKDAEMVGLGIALAAAGGVLVPAIGVGLAIAGAVGILGEANEIADRIDGTSSPLDFAGGEVVNTGIDAFLEGGIASALANDFPKLSGNDVNALSQLFGGAISDFMGLVTSHAGTTAQAVNASTVTQRDFVLLALRSASPQLWHDLTIMRDKRGWAPVENLVLNKAYIDDGSIEAVTHALANAPDASGAAALVLKASVGRSYTPAYALRFAQSNRSADRYTRDYTVTYTPVTGFTAAGDPTFGSAQTATLTIPVEAFLGQWYFTQHVPVGPSDLRAWNMVMKLNAGIAAGLRSHATIWTPDGFDARLQAWIHDHAPALTLPLFVDDGLY